VPHATPDPALAATVRMLREERGVTREALAVVAGIAVGSLAGIELARSSPSWDTFKRVAAALDLSTGQLADAIDASGAQAPRSSLVRQIEQRAGPVEEIDNALHGAPPTTTSIASRPDPVNAAGNRCRCRAHRTLGEVGCQEQYTAARPGLTWSGELPSRAVGLVRSRTPHTIRRDGDVPHVRTAIVPLFAGSLGSS
jgi:transcriptional regulator with XRE-family HTH domain